MKLGLMLPCRRNIQWTLAAQLGVEAVVTKAAPELSGLSDPSDYESLKFIRDQFQDAGLNLYALEGDEFDMSRIKLGLPGRDEDIEKYCKMLTNMGRLGLKLLCYNFMAGVGWFRSRNDLRERGGALTSGFDISEIDNNVPLKFSEEQLWDNYAYFLRAVMPAAEAAGVKMGLHPDDPPLSPFFGYPRILTSADAYRRAMSLSDSPSHGITFCQATFRAMGEDVFKTEKLEYHSAITPAEAPEREGYTFNGWEGLLPLNWIVPEPVSAHSAVNVNPAYVADVSA